MSSVFSIFCYRMAIAALKPDLWFFGSLITIVSVHNDLLVPVATGLHFNFLIRSSYDNMNERESQKVIQAWGTETHTVL